MGHLHTQEYHLPGRSALCKFTNNNPFFTCCKVVSNCFLLFITWKTNSEPFRHRRLFHSCFNSVLILLDMALSCGSAPNSSLACDSFTLEQHTHTHTHTLTYNYRYIQWIQFLKYTLWIVRERERDRQTEKSCTVLTTDGVVPHQNLMAVTVQTPLFWRMWKTADAAWNLTWYNFNTLA